jgi:hypothetical protein
VPKPQCRFTVNANGFERQILSVVEASDGSLEFFPTMHPEVDHPKGYRTKNKNYYLSLHPTTDKHWFTINQNQSFSDSSVSGRIHVAKPISGFTIPVFGRLCPSLLINYPTKSLRKKDTKICVGKYNPINETLIYVLFCRNSSGSQIVANKAFIYQYVEFSVFRLFIVPMVIRIPSTGSGGGILFGEFNERWNNEDITNIDPPKLLDSLNSNDVSEVLTVTIESFRPKLAKFAQMYGHSAATVALSQIVAPLPIEANH